MSHRKSFDISYPTVALNSVHKSRFESTFFYSIPFISDISSKIQWCNTYSIW